LPWSFLLLPTPELDGHLLHNGSSGEHKCPGNVCTELNTNAHTNIFVLTSVILGSIATGAVVTTTVVMIVVDVIGTMEDVELGIWEDIDVVLL
jgi:hypothetical protein